MALSLSLGPPKPPMPRALGSRQDWFGWTRGEACRLGFPVALAPPPRSTPMMRTASAGRTRTRSPGGAVRMALPFELSAETAVPALAVTTLLSFATVRAVVYFRMQYIIAAMLSRHVPRGGPRVLDLSIHEGRNLYYYPKDTVQVVTVSPKSNVQMLERQAVNAGVPIVVKSKPLDDTGVPANSMDAVVSVYCLCDVADDKIPGVLREAVRTLKPGKPFIFVENVGSKGQLVRAAQSVLESFSKLLGSSRTYSRGLLKFIQETEGLQDLEFEHVLDFQDPHLVGVAKKKLAAPTPDSRSIRDEAAAGKRRTRKSSN